MNAYIIVEGSQTEMRVYPAWLGIVVLGKSESV